MANLFQGLLELVGTLIREKEILEPCEAYESREAIDINNNQNLSTMNQKVIFNWANALVVFTTALTGVMSCITILNNKVNFNAEKCVHDVLPLFVDGMLHCIEWTEDK